MIKEIPMMSDSKINMKGRDFWAMCFALKFASFLQRILHRPSFKGVKGQSFITFKNAILNLNKTTRVRFSTPPLNSISLYNRIRNKCEGQLSYIG